MPTARVDGLDLYYEVHGRGRPLVLIPGLGGDISLFHGVIGDLAARRRVLAFDPRGAGRSDKPDVPYSIDLMADDAAGLLETLAVGPADVAGFSMGGRIALSLALRHSGRVRGLVLAATSARTVEGPLTRARRRVSDVTAHIPVLSGRVLGGSRPGPGYLRQRTAWRSFDCSARLGEIRVPTLILHGRDDRVVPYERAVELRAGIEASRLVCFPGDHLFFLSGGAPRVAAEVLEFTDPL